MTKIIQITGRGALTLPREMRRRFGSGRDVQIVAEETDKGILLRPVPRFRVELYSERRLAEFRRHNEESLSGFHFEVGRRVRVRRNSSFGS
jgi:bifunctional DNA-binding transcriptional regulator/antitoxin component of YhaV-PrlF toxin-antitoxin module